MASKQKNLFLLERGFGGNAHGEAVILCGPEGEPLYLRHMIMPNGSMGGQLTVVPLGIRDPKRASSDINSKETIFEIRVIRNTERLTGGSVRIKEVDAINLSVKMFEIGYIYEPGHELEFVDGSEMLNSETAKELLQGVLNKAFQAALDRGFDRSPKKLYYGMVAPDVAPIKKQWYNQETKQFQDEKPVYSNEFMAVLAAKK